MPRPLTQSLGAAIDDQFRHHGAGAGPELKTVQREAELMIEPLVTRTWAEHGNVVLHLRLDAGPGAHDRRIAHHRKQLEHGARAGREALPVQHRLVAVLIRRRQMTAADQHGAVLELLEGEFSAAQDHDGVDEVRHPRGDHQHRRHGLDRHRLAECGRDFAGPGAGGVDQHRCSKAFGADIDVPEAVAVPDVAGGHTLAHGGAELLRLAPERRRRLRRIGRTVAARDHTTGTGLGHSRDQPTQFSGVDQFLMGEAERVQFGNAGTASGEFILVLRNQNLAVAFKTAIVVEEF